MSGCVVLQRGSVFLSVYLRAWKTECNHLELLEKLQRFFLVKPQNILQNIVLIMISSLFVYHGHTNRDIVIISNCDIPDLGFW